MFKVDTSGLDKLIKSLETIRDESIVDKSAEYVSISALSNLKMNTPVLTGHLRRSWSIEKEKDGNSPQTTISNNVVYLLPVNYGRAIKRADGTVSHTQGQYFIERAMENTFDDAPKLIDYVSQNAFRKGGFK